MIPADGESKLSVFVPGSMFIAESMFMPGSIFMPGDIARSFSAGAGLTVRQLLCAWLSQHDRSQAEVEAGAEIISNANTVVNKLVMLGTELFYTSPGVTKPFCSLADSLRKPKCRLKGGST
jgi:hypothetical protein